MAISLGIYPTFSGPNPNGFGKFDSTPFPRHYGRSFPYFFAGYPPFSSRLAQDISVAHLANLDDETAGTWLGNG